MLIIGRAFGPWVEELERAPFVLYLTGSRFFRTDHEDSDWDFFTAETEEAIAWLADHGYKLVSKSNYLDENIASVWQTMNVHVQLARDVIKKQREQEIIYTKPALLRLMSVTDKLYHRYIWELAKEFDSHASNLRDMQDVAF